MRVILLSFLSLFLLQCSVADPTSSWLENAQGSRYLTEIGSEWLNTTVEIEGTANEGDTISIASDGSFTVGNTTFKFEEIDSTGMFALYSFTVNETTKYIALGFNSNYDILYAPDVYASLNATITTTTGNTLLEKK